MLLFNLYTDMCNIIAQKIQQIDEKKRCKINVVLMHMLASLYIIIRIFSDGLNRIGFGPLDTICTFILIFTLIIILHCGTETNISNINKKVVKVYFFFSIALIISLLVCSFPWRKIASIFVIVILLPFAYTILFDRKTYYAFLKELSCAFVNMGFILHILNIVLSPRVKGDTSAYMGLIANPNTLAMTLVPTLLCALYLYTITKSHRIYYLGIIGYTMGIIVMSESRTSFCMSCIAVICWIVYSLRHYRVLQKKIRIQLSIVVILIATLTLGIFVTDKINEITAREVAYAQTSSSSWESFMDKSESKSAFGMNNFLSGRVELWKYYTEDVTLFGHDYQSSIEQKQNDSVVLGSHNTLIYYLYTNGIFAAIGMLLIEVVGCAYTLRKIGKISNDNLIESQINLFSVIFIPAYCAGNLVEDLYEISRWGICLMFYISFVPVLYSKEKANIIKTKKKSGKHYKNNQVKMMENLQNHYDMVN